MEINKDPYDRTQCPDCLGMFNMEISYCPPHICLGMVTRLKEENRKLILALEQIRAHQSFVIMGEKNLSTTYRIADMALQEIENKTLEK